MSIRHGRPATHQYATRRLFAPVRATQIMMTDVSCTSDYTHCLLRHLSGDADAKRIADVTTRALKRFMSGCKIPVSTSLPDPTGEVKRRVQDECLKHDLRKAILFEQSLQTGVNIATTAYAHCHIDVQVYIATYTLLLTLLDNFSVEPAHLTAYIAGEGRVQEPIFEWLSECMMQTYDYFVPYAANAIVVSTWQWLNSLQLDNIVNGAPLDRGNIRFAEYRRMRSGDPAAYAFFIFDKYSFPDMMSYMQVIPDAMLCINYVNDITSFYKEELAEEPNTYARDRASATGKSTEGALGDIVEQVIAASERIEKILSGTQAREIWHQFATGYFYFHVFSDRYRLRELEIFSKLDM